MKITVDYNAKIYITALLNCFAAANPPATYTWLDENKYQIATGQTLTVDKGGEYTCNASNVIGGTYYTQSKSVHLLSK